MPRSWDELWQPGRLRPMLARRARQPFSSPAYRFEVKWDGYRCLAFLDHSATFLQSRRGHDLRRQFPELASLHRQVDPPAVLDGEIVAVANGRPSFAALQRRYAEIQSFPGDRGVQVVLVAFDLLGVRGRVLLAHPLAERVALLERLLAPGGDGRLLTSPAVVGNGEEFFREVRQLGLEGVVAKRLDSPYLPGMRTDHWHKIKGEQTVEAVVGGVTAGSRMAGVGALLLGMYDARGRLVDVGQVSTGLGSREVQHLRRRLRPRTTPPFQVLRRPPAPGQVVWTEPTQVCEVSFLEWTREGRLRHPVFLRFRDDIAPEECRLPADGADADALGPGSVGRSEDAPGF